jgi:hypothetical protein
MMVILNAISLSSVQSSDSPVDDAQSLIERHQSSFELLELLENLGEIDRRTADGMKTK